jgi:ketosteroid isomerase-like protein
VSSRVKGIVAGLIVLVILGVAAAVVMMNRPEDSGNTEVTTAATEPVTSRLIYDIDPAKIVSIFINNEYGNYYVDRYNIDGADIWSIEEYSTLPLDSNFIVGMMTGAATFTAARVVTDTPADISVYGLSEPRAEVITLFDGGVMKDMLIGNPSPMAGETYVMLSGEDTVYTIADTTIANFLADKKGAISKTVYTPKQATSAEDTTPYTRINKMTIDRSDLTYDIVIEYDRRKDDPDRIVSNQTIYRMTSPVTLDLDPDRAEATVGTVFSLKASAVTAVFPDEATLAEYGFYEPFGNVEFDIVGGPFGMTFGNEIIGEDGAVTGRYCMVDDLDVIYEFPTEMLPWTTIKPLEITASLITANYIFDLDGVSIYGSGYDEQFVQTGTSDDDFVVTHNGEKVTDNQSYKTFYQFLLRVPAEELFLEDVTDEPVLTVHIYGEGIDDKLEFITSDNRRTIIRYNGVTSFKVKTAYVNRLIDNIKLYNEGKPIVTTW